MAFEQVNTEEETEKAIEDAIAAGCRYHFHNSLRDGQPERPCRYPSSGGADLQLFHLHVLFFNLYLLCKNV